MKPSLALVVIAAASFGAARASADTPPAPAAVPAGVYVLDEAADGWLHDHCSYRGLADYSTALLERPGTVAKLAYSEGAVHRVKVFRCAEAPAFANATFKPAPIASVRCAEARPSDELCVKPIAQHGATLAPSTTASASASATLSVAAASESVTWSPANLRVRGSTSPPEPAPLSSHRSESARAARPK